MATSRARSKKIVQVLLADLVLATNSEQGFLWAMKDTVAELVEKGFAIINPDPESVNKETEEIQVAATDEGVAEYAKLQTEQQPADGATAATPETAPVAKTKVEKMEFVIEDDVKMPETKRGGRSGTKYPFEKLEKVGQSFVIPATAERPNPVKALGSTVSAANKRAAAVTLKEGETAAKYAVRADEKGARIFRVA